METSRCFSCGGEFRDVPGPVHRYMKSSAGCWATYGEILAREYSNPDYFRFHWLTVNAYAVQHPGSTDRQSIQSVGVHLVSLCLYFEYNLTALNTGKVMQEASKNKHDFWWLAPPCLRVTLRLRML